MISAIKLSSICSVAYSISSSSLYASAGFFPVYWRSLLQGSEVFRENFNAMHLKEALDGSLVTSTPIPSFLTSCSPLVAVAAIGMLNSPISSLACKVKTRRLEAWLVQAQLVGVVSRRVGVVLLLK